MALKEKDLNVRTICNELRSVRWRWLLIGIHLGIPRFKLMEFQEDSDPLSAVVDYWLRGNADQSDVPIAWQSIVEALKHMSELGLAEKIRTQYCQERNVFQRREKEHLNRTSTYSAYLKKTYANKVFSDGKWPPIPTNSYINLAIASHTPRDFYEIREYRLHGNVKQMLQGRESIKLEDIFNGYERKSMILIEGAPGMGKSMLTWELCSRWGDGASFMKHFSLVVLHRLRDRYSQQISRVRDLFPHEDENLQLQVHDYNITANEGKGVLFILDGFDEFPHKASQDNFLIKTVTGQVLPEATVIVTTRPAATATFFTHRRKVDQHIEILGFTREQVKEFASDTFSQYEPKVLESFMKYIEA